MGFMKNNRFLILNTLWPILVALIAVAISYGALNKQVETQKEQLTATSTKTTANEIAITELRTDIKYIREAVDRINRKLEKNESSFVK